MSATTYRFELETLSPVMVTAGRDARLSPYTDFVQEGRELVYLDPRKVEAVLAERPPAVMDDFVRGVRTGMDNNRSTFNLGDFIRTRLGTTAGALALRRVPVQGSVQRNHVRRHLSNGGQPYVPGSTLKGSIRTALMYGWLIDDAEGLRYVDELKDRVDALWERFHGELAAAEQLYREAQEAYEARDFRVKGEKEAGARRLADRLRRPVEEALALPAESPLFISSDRVRSSEMRLLRVSDTDPLPRSVTRVVEVTRFKLADGTSVSPQWSETIPGGVRTRFTLTVERSFAHRHLQYLNQDSILPLLASIDRFAADCIEWEMKVLEELSAVTALDGVFDREARIEESDPSDDAALMRIGGGKTYFDNSIGLALHQRDPEAFDRFRRLLGLGRNPRTHLFSQKRFPATRSYVAERRGRDVVAIGPLGWVRITATG